MFFFWGIFRGKRVGGLQHGSGSPKKIYSSRDFPAANLSSPENICSPVPMDKDVPPCNRDCKGNCVISAEEQPEYGWDCNSVNTNQMKPPQSWEDIRSRILLEGQVDSDCKAIKGPLASIGVANCTSGSNISDEKKSSDSNIPADRNPFSQNYSDFSAGVQALTSISSGSEVHNKDKRKPTNTEVRLLEKKNAPERATMRFSGPMELNSWPSTGRKQSMFDLTLPKSEATSTGSIQADSMSDNVESASKKRKLDYSDLYVSTDHTDSSRDTSMIRNSIPGSLVKKRNDKGSDEASMSRALKNAERYFFPTDPHHEKHVNLGDSFVLRKRALSDNGEPAQERVPNLNLALGAELIPPLKSSLPHFLAAEVEKSNRDQPCGRTATTSEEDISAALSLSLSFPFSDKEREGQLVATNEHLRARGQNEVNFTSHFREFSDK